MSSINNTTSTQSTYRSNTSTATRPSTPAPTVNRTEAPKTESRPTDRTSISNEGRQSSGNQGASMSLLDGLRDNYSSSASKETAKDETKKEPAAEAKTPDQKLDQVKSTIDSLKGLKGDDLKAKLDEIKKTDPELAEYLQKMLEKDDKAEKTGDDKKEVAEAKPAEKAQNAGGDDGAPSETFLWKPTSDSDGKLVILLPSSISASSVSISGPSGSDSVSKGGKNGSRGNGQREHYRFNKSGKDMQGPVQVTIALENGGSKNITIAKPSERSEGGSLSDGGNGAGGQQ